MRVQAAGVCVRIDDTQILGDVDIVAESGEISGLIGPNGSGKSTLLRCIYRALRPAAGVVHLGDDDVWHLGAREAARRRAVVAQDHGLDHDYSVHEVVEMGRTPHKGLLDRDDAADEVIVRTALDRVEMGWAAQRIFSTLSGGERQRVLVARALAQQARILVLDEPTNHLDIRSQLELLSLIRELRLTTIVALHDLDHAANYCDRITVLSKGRVVATGLPIDVLTPAMLAQIFGVSAHIGRHPITGQLHVATATLARG
jgi:iron complex transport system ATP-binding protein